MSWCLLVNLLLLFLDSSQAEKSLLNPTKYHSYDIAKENARQGNMCPFLVGTRGKRLPVICWHCGFPSGMHTSSRYEYDCCPGYERSDLVDNKCVAMEPNWKTIPEYLNDKGHTETANALSKNSNLPLTEPSSGRVFTVFVPANDGDIKSREVDYTSEPQAARHLVSGQRIYAYSLKNGQRIPNEAGGDMKVSSYSNGLTFVDCKMLTSVDHEATNGVVHYVDGALPLSNRHRTVMSRLNAEPSISQFVQALPQDVRSRLSQEKSATWYTVFAPTNEAWSRAMAEAGSPQDLARNHILPRMMCSSAATQDTGKIGPTLSGEHFRMAVTNRPDGPVVVDQCNEDIQMTQKDLMSDGGVVHIVDKAISSLKSMNLRTALQCLQRDRQGETSRAAREMLTCNVPSSSGSRMVVLLPTNQAYSGEVGQRLQSSNGGFRCNVYSHNLLTPVNRQAVVSGTNGLTQEETFTTEYVSPDGKKPTVTATYTKGRYGSRLNFNGAQAASLEPMEFKDGFIYPVNQLNAPPEKSMTRLIADEPDTRQIYEKIRSTGMDSTFQQHTGKILFLAPIDKGWSTRDLENGYSSAQNRKLLQLHSIPHPIFGGEHSYLSSSTVQRVNSLLKSRDGSPVKLTIKRAPDGNTFIGHDELPEDLWAMVLKWDKVGTDGMVWIVDWPIKCPTNLC